MALIDWALEYEHRGWSIFPTRQDDPKRPALSWERYQQSRACVLEVKGWFDLEKGKHRDGGIALVCGQISGGIYVIDCDSQESMMWAAENLPTTLMSRTGGGGCHYFYRHDSELRPWVGGSGPTKRFKDLPDFIDFRADGSYVVAPPTVHKSGKAYAWHNDAEIAVLPAWWISKYCGVADGHSSGSSIQCDGDIVDLLTETVGEGMRNHACARVAGAFISGLEEVDTLAALLHAVGNWNQMQCDPPLEDAEVEQTCISIWKTNGRNKKCQTEQVSNQPRGKYAQLTSTASEPCAKPSPLQRDERPSSLESEESEPSSVRSEWRELSTAKKLEPLQGENDKYASGRSKLSSHEKQTRTSQASIESNKLNVNGTSTSKESQGSTSVSQKSGLCQKVSGVTPSTTSSPSSLGEKSETTSQQARQSTKETPDATSDKVDSETVEEVAERPTAGLFGASVDGWPEPVPFNDDASPMPEWPEGKVFGGIYDEYISAVSDVVDVDRCMPASALLGVLACCWQRRGAIRLLSSWVEPINLYICNVAESGERKSAVLRRMRKPILDFQTKDNEDRANAIAKASADLKMMETELTGLHRLVTKATDDDRDHLENDIYKLTIAIEEHDTKMARVWMSNDITNERLGMLLQDNRETASIMSSEGGIFDIIAGSYSGNLSNFDVYLQAYDGDHIAVQRVGRGDIFLKHPLLTIYLASQLELIEKIYRNEALMRRGFLARFLFGLCPSRVGDRVISTKHIPEGTERAYQSSIREMLRGYSDEHETQIMTLSANAAEMWEGVANYIETLQACGGQLANHKDYGSKLAGKIGRIAGLLHIVDNPQTWAQKQVSGEVMERASTLGKYFMDNFLWLSNKVSNANSGEATVMAEGILDYLRGAGLTEFTPRGIVRSVRNVKNSEECSLAIEELQWRGWVKPKVSLNLKNRGRPAAATYIVHPSIGGELCL